MHELIWILCSSLRNWSCKVVLGVRHTIRGQRMFVAHCTQWLSLWAGKTKYIGHTSIFVAARQTKLCHRKKHEVEFTGYMRGVTCGQEVSDQTIRLHFCFLALVAFGSHCVARGNLGGWEHYCVLCRAVWVYFYDCIMPETIMSHCT